MISKNATRNSRSKLRQVVSELEAIAPRQLAAEWDNVGLLAGDLDAPCRRALLTIDLTPAVLDESQRLKSDLIIAYHPPILRPVASLTAQSHETDALVFRSISRGQAVYALHTALDAAPGGTNDVLAEMCGLRDTVPFEDCIVASRQSKVVVFVPPADLARVSEAMFSTGAGQIGAYSECSFSTPGTGTFFGSDETTPAVGQRGRRERVDEIRLEMICSNDRLSPVLQALRRAHPYEEPAFDVYPLVRPPDSGAGMGRVGRFSGRTTLASLARRLKRALGLRGLEVIGEMNASLSTAAVCAGSAGRLPLESARAREADVIVTGELRHHDRLLFARLGYRVILVGHCNSERPVLPFVKQRLEERVPSLEIKIASSDRPPAHLL